MQNPPHPGGSLQRQCLEPLGFSITGAAEIIGMTRQFLSEPVNVLSGDTPDMAIRLSRAFGSTSEMWLGMQMTCDLWQARDRANGIKVERVRAA